MKKFNSLVGLIIFFGSIILIFYGGMKAKQPEIIEIPKLYCDDQSVMNSLILTDDAIIEEYQSTTPNELRLDDKLKDRERFLLELE